MSFLDTVAFPTCEEGIYYRGDFVFEDVFPELVSWREKLQEAWDAANAEAGEELDWDTARKRVDVGLFKLPLSDRERAERLLDKAFCDADGGDLVYRKPLSDLRIRKVLKLFEDFKAEVDGVGKQSSAAVTGSI